MYPHYLKSCAKKFPQNFEFSAQKSIRQQPPHSMPKFHRSWRTLPNKHTYSRPPRRRSSTEPKTRILRPLLWALTKKLAPFLIILALIFSSMLAGAFWWYGKNLPDPNKLMERSVAQSTKIYDRTGEHLLYEIHGDEKRTLILLSALPEYVRWATIALEDKNFYSHKGFDFWGIVRASITNLVRGDLTAQGGSTITQQFVKNAILSRERNYARKIKELILAYQIEKRFSKDEILQLYLNEIPYGANAYGIQSASQTFFGKDASVLTIAEAATLAALPKAPSTLSPFGPNRDRLLARQQFTLKKMLELGYLNEDQYQQAKNQKIEFRSKLEKIEAPHFVFYIKDYLAEKYGETVAEQGGLRVVTTLDYDMQKAAEEAIAFQEKNIISKDGSNASLVAIDPKTGQILAMVGSMDFFNATIDGQVNVALRDRQPGSSLKPFVYLAAFMKGYTPNTILYDAVTDFDTGNGTYTPHNFNSKEYGPVTMRKALAGSLNIPAVKTLYLAGIKNTLTLLSDFGYTTLKDESRYGLSLVLGGGEVKLLEHVAAYGTLANEGVRHATSSILKIDDNNGNTLEEYKDKSFRVVDSQLTRLVTDIIQDNNARSYIFGAKNYLVLQGRQAAAKTGTTNDFRDAWTIGYTSSLASGVWVGNNNNKAMNGEGGSTLAAPIWNMFMKKALSKLPQEAFTPPEPIITNKPVLDGVAGEVRVNIDRYSGKLATKDTPASAIEERTYREAHTILYYVNKDDPQGSSPTEPANDPQFHAWEGAVQRWAQEKKIIQEVPPSNYDDVHIPTNLPTLSIIFPIANAVITTQELPIQLTASAPRGISKVMFDIDNINQSNATTSPFSATLSLQNLAKGSHTLKITARDDVENSVTTEIPFIYEGPSTVYPAPTQANDTEIKTKPETTTIKATWLTPIHTNSFALSQFPITLNISASDTGLIKRVNFYAVGANRIPSLLDSIKSPSSTPITAFWRIAPKTGSYALYAQIIDKNNIAIKTNEVTITIKE